MNKLSSYDIRQLLLIKSKIKLFDSNKISLHSLICDLTGLLNSLESVSEKLKGSFQNELNTLEMIYDSLCEGSISKWEGNYKNDLNDAITKITSLVSDEMDEYLNISDPEILENATILNSNWFICPKCNDAWESDSIKLMVICPHCTSILHNPHKKQTKHSSEKEN